jgi:hypothetical protein
MSKGIRILLLYFKITILVLSLGRNSLIAFIDSIYIKEFEHNNEHIMGFGTLKCTWRRKFHGFITLLLQLPCEQTKSPILNHISILGSGCALDF